MRHLHIALPRFDATAFVLLAACHGASCARPIEAGKGSESVSPTLIDVKQSPTASANPRKKNAIQASGYATQTTDKDDLTELEVQPMGQMRRSTVHARKSQHRKAVLVETQEAQNNKIGARPVPTQSNVQHTNALHDACDIRHKIIVGENPKEVLDLLRACTKALGDFALKTKQGNKVSKEANEAYMNEYHSILRLINTMKDIKSMTDALNKDHLKAVNYLLGMAGTIETDIGNLLPPGRAMLPTHATIMPPQALNATTLKPLENVDEENITATAQSTLDPNPHSLLISTTLKLEMPSSSENETLEVNQIDEQKHFSQELGHDKNMLPSSITSKPLHCMMDEIGKPVMAVMRKPSDPDNVDNQTWVCDLYFQNGTQGSELQGQYLGTFSFSDVHQHKHNSTEDELVYEGAHLTMDLHSDEIEFLESMTSVLFEVEEVDNTFMGIIWEEHDKGTEFICEALDSSLSDREAEEFDDGASTLSS